MKKGIENRVIALDALTPHQRNYNRHSAAHSNEHDQGETQPEQSDAD